ncbi:hypothetical protein OTU49_003078, partial [Cherax quadricarinatus]
AIIAILATLAASAPQDSYRAPHQESREDEVVPILRDERVHDEDGKFNFEIETGNGISISQAGLPDDDSGAVIKAGKYSYTAPDGTLVEVKFVADENGFQPHSDHLPVAPEFPHPIPQFVLDQIIKAAAEDAARAEDTSSSEEGADYPSVSSPNRVYGVPH